MHRRIAFSVVLALALAGTAYAKGGASITAGDGPFHFGQTTGDLVASWTPRNGPQPDFGYWARADCYQGGKRVYVQYVELGAQGGFTLGPTPSWSGGGADCTLSLVTFGYSDGGTVVAADSFPVDG